MCDRPLSAQPRTLWLHALLVRRTVDRTYEQEVRQEEMMA